MTVIASKCRHQTISDPVNVIEPTSLICNMACVNKEVGLERICEQIGNQRGYVSAYLLPEYIDENEKQIAALPPNFPTRLERLPLTI